MAVIRDDSEGLLATFDEVGRVALRDAVIPVIAVSLFFLQSVWFAHDEFAAPEGSSLVGVVALVAAIAMATLLIATLRHRFLFHQRLRFAITARGLGWSSGRWRSEAPWSAIRVVEAAHHGRTLRVHLHPSGMVRIPLWSQWSGKRSKDLPLADLGLDPFTLNAALKHFSTPRLAVDHPPAPPWWEDSRAGRVRT